jgi:hypothetical protein
MFPPGDQSLTSPCLPQGWRDYKAFAGLFALIATLTTQFIQTTAINHFARNHNEEECRPHDHHRPVHNHDHSERSLHGQVDGNTSSDELMTGHDEHDEPHTSHGKSCSHKAHNNSSKVKPSSSDTQSALSNEKMIGHGDIEAGSTNSRRQLTSERRRSVPLELGALAVATNIHSDGCCEVDHVILAHANHSHLQITAYILEFGIALHSLM